MRKGVRENGKIVDNAVEDCIDKVDVEIIDGEERVGFSEDEEANQTEFEEEGEKRYLRNYFT